MARFGWREASTRSLRAIRLAGIATVVMSGAPSVATAHSLGGRVETPLPFVAYVLGAAVAVAASFAIMAASDAGPPKDPSPGTTRSVPGWLRLALRGVGLLAWLWIVAQAAVGGSSDADVASLFLWVYGWVGVAIVSALVGPVWEWLDPFTTLYDVIAAIGRRLGIGGLDPGPWPSWLGRWAAVAGLSFFIWLELVGRVLQGRPLAIVLVGYTIITLLAMAQYGRDAWRERGETFSVWFGVLGRLAPFALVGPPEEGRVHRRPIGLGLVEGRWPIELVVMVALGTGSIIYDGLSQTSTFFQWFGFPSLPVSTALLAMFLAALVGAMLLVGRRVGMAAMGAGLLPVAVGYLIAHYLSSLLLDGQRILIAVSDPFQQAWDLFGTAFIEPTVFLATGVAWSIQVGAVVIGHIVGAWAGHAATRSEAASARGMRRTGPPARSRASVRAQLPLAVLMVTLTSLTLWSLGQNLVFETEAPERTVATAR